MKKIFILIMAVAAMFNLCACSKELNDDPEVNPDSEKAIVFDNVQTRAFINSADSIFCMGVFGQKNLGDEDKNEAGSNSYTMILENEKVSRDSLSAPWTYEKTRYWARNRVYHFFAVWPYSKSDDNYNSSVTNVSSVEGDGAYSYRVTFETPETADLELLTAKTKVKTETGKAYPESVHFNFQHDLSNINLKIWSNGAPESVDDSIRVKKVTLSNVTKKGTLNTTINGSSWKLSSDKMTFTKVYESEGEDEGEGEGEDEYKGITVSKAQIIGGKLVPNSDNNPGIPFGEDGLLLIPHTITNSTPVLVTVIYYLKRPTDEEWEKKKLQALLPEGTWLAGKRLTYNLIISGEKTITEFQINVVVEDWNRQPEEINFTDQVEVEEKMQWVEGTYESLSKEKGEVVLYTDADQVAICKFKILNPAGATWTASLIPLTASAMDAFSIVEDSKHGVVGTDDWQYVKIRINNPDPISARNECLLRITVQTSDGRTIVVRNLMPPETDKGIEEFKIIQNLING